MTNDLTSPTEMTHLPGAPFTAAEVDGAVAALRTYLGWHIAPVKTETVSMDVLPAEQVLRLPTRKLESVVAVRRTSDAVVYTATVYEVSKARARVRRKGAYWPDGYEAVEVDMTHGFDACPPELLSALGQVILAGRRDRGIRQVSVDDGSTTFGLASAMFDSLLDEGVLRAYSVYHLPGMA